MKYAELVAKHGSIAEAARQVGLARTTFSDHYHREKHTQASDTVEVTIEPPAGMITSVDELLPLTGYDPDTWVIVGMDAGAWPQALGEQRVAQFQRISVKLARILPAGVRPVQPLDATPIPIPEIQTSKCETALFIPDPQIGHWWGNEFHTLLHPMHSRRVLDLAVQLLRDLQPSECHLLGDLFDETAWSLKFLREPCHSQTTQAALDEAYWWLAQMRAAAPRTRFKIHEGNHDKRIRDMVSAKVAEAYLLRRASGGKPVLSLEHLLELETLGMELVGPYEKGCFLWGDVFVHHGQIVRPGGTAKALLMSEPGLHHVFGHVHREELAWRTTHGQRIRQFFAATPGCAARIEAGIVPGAKPRQDWQQGLLTVEKVGEMRYPHLHHIENGQMRVNGRTYTGLHHTEEIRNATGWIQFQDR